MTQATNTNQRGTQVQHACLMCVPNREFVKQLADQATQRLTEVGGIATLLSCGVAPKQQHGYIVLEVVRGVPQAFSSWLQEEPRITEYLVYDVPSSEQERLTAEEYGERWYTPKLEAPELPQGYSLLSQPLSLDSPSDELWMAHVQGDKPHEDEGILFYEENSALFFFTEEEAINITAYLLTQARALLSSCSPEFLQAPQHVQRLAMVKDALAAIEEGHADDEM